MKKNIKEPICSYEVSKLLSKKGFDLNTPANYWILYSDHQENYSKKLPLDESKIFLTLNDSEFRNATYINEEYDENVFHVLRVPTQALAIEWIKQNFNKVVIEHLSYDMSEEEINGELEYILKKL